MRRGQPKLVLIFFAITDHRSAHQAGTRFCRGAAPKDEYEDPWGSLHLEFVLESMLKKKLSQLEVY